MPTLLTHIVVSGVLGKFTFSEPMPARFWILSAFCTVLPDIDIIGFYYGIKYGDMFGHRGFTHSLAFALLAGLLVVLCAFPALRRFSKRWWGTLAFFSLVTASHGLLDAMTDKGLGVGFLIPFDDTRYFMPWRPIFASPMRIAKLFSRTGYEVLREEIVWIWVPMLLAFAGMRFFRGRKKNPSPSPSL